MQADLGDVFADVANGDLSKVTGWLKEHIHRHASFKKPGQLFEEVCGKFDASCFTDYLTKKGIDPMVYGIDPTKQECSGCCSSCSEDK